MLLSAQLPLSRVRTEHTFFQAPGALSDFLLFGDSRLGKTVFGQLLI